MQMTINHRGSDVHADFAGCVQKHWPCRLTIIDATLSVAAPPLKFRLTRHCRHGELKIQASVSLPCCTHGQAAPVIVMTGHACLALEFRNMLSSLMLIGGVLISAWSLNRSLQPWLSGHADSLRTPQGAILLMLSATETLWIFGHHCGCRAHVKLNKTWIAKTYFS
jgi:hypothetical protein